MRSPLATLERRFIQGNVHRFPRWIEGYHLTLLTIAWSAGLIGFGWLAASNPHWLWGSSAMLVAQWFTDGFDGALGRHRDTGIPRWGYFMDHMLDFLFMWCIPVSYAFMVVEPRSVNLLFVFAFVYSAMMANSFLAFPAFDEFKITYLGMGPTEIRLFFVGVNTALIFAGPAFLEAALPWAVGIMSAALVVIVYRTQRRIRAIDMSHKGRARDS